MGSGWEGDAGGNLQRKRDLAGKVFERGGVDKKREKLEKENRKLKEAVGELTLELKKTTGEAAKVEEFRGEREPARGNSRTQGGPSGLNHKRVWRLMKSANLLVPKREKWTTSSPNEFWGTDMTKALTPGQVWVYVHAVIDWQAALNAQFPQGIAEIPEGKRPFLVSDPGCQPALESYKNYCKSLGIR